MRFIYLLLVALILCAPARAQSIAYSQTAFTRTDILSHEQPLSLSYHGYRREHCKAVTIGKVLMITGGALCVAGGIGFATMPQDDSGIALYILSLMALSGGSECLLAGGIVFGCGKIHDHIHRYTFSVESNQQGIGIACHF